MSVGVLGFAWTGPCSPQGRLKSMLCPGITTEIPIALAGARPNVLRLNCMAKPCSGPDDRFSNVRSRKMVPLRRTKRPRICMPLPRSAGSMIFLGADTGACGWMERKSRSPDRFTSMVGCGANCCWGGGACCCWGGGAAREPMPRKSKSLAGEDVIWVCAAACALSGGSAFKRSEMSSSCASRLFGCVSEGKSSSPAPIISTSSLSSGRKALTFFFSLDTKVSGGLWYTDASVEIWPSSESNSCASRCSVSSEMRGFSDSTTAFAASGSVDRRRQ
mmetsp:Transcript_37360/g.93846  ORF Transcript_37360/g.93846 Transcript_37360/m.93846 type:complete len:275 (-) Transcript_37360:1748-2572(-)